MVAGAEFINPELLAHLPRAFARSLGVVLMLPVGTDLAGWLARLGLTAALTIFALPFLSGEVASLSLLPFEVVCGALVALPLSLMIHVIEGWGELFDTQRGQNIAFQYDQSAASATMPISQIMRWYLWAVLAQFGVLGVLVANFLLSFNSIQIPLLFEAGFALSAINFICASLMSMFVLFMPIAAFFFACDLLLGIVARYSPGALVQGEAFVIKTFFGGFILYLLINETSFVADIARLAMVPIEQGLGL